jgi:monovalent cation/hydrogen antiporter
VIELLTVVGLVTVVVAVSAIARRLGLLAPIMLLLAGTALSFVPGLPRIELDPEIVLTWILPPLVYVAAVNTSVPAFRFNLRPILLLAIGLVLFTAFAVGFALHLVLPAVPFAAALALGAVVSPPDAVSATAIARRIGLPRRTVAILEGESLVNDATALALFGVAVAAATGGTVSAGAITLNALLVSVGGVAVGVLGAAVFGAVHRRVTDPLLDNAVSLIAPFVVYAAAAAIHASGVVAVVVTGLSLGHRYPVLVAAASRLQMEAFWRMVSFVLEGAVFVLVGLQLRVVLEQLTDTPVPMVVLATVVVIGTVIAARFAWMYPATYLARLVPRVRERDPAPSLRVPTILAWAGMRGVVTLATALALPPTLAHGAGYPRDLFVFLAFATIVVTLLLQGLTLPRVARWLRVPPDDPKADALAEAAVQQSASHAARERLEAELSRDGEVPADVVDRLRTKMDLRTNMAWERLGGRRRETPTETYSRLRAAMLEAEREVFRRARDEGRIPEEVLRQAQRDMDLEESLLERKK